MCSFLKSEKYSKSFVNNYRSEKETKILKLDEKVTSKMRNPDYMI